MKSKFTLIFALFFTICSHAQDTRCTNVVYHSTFYWSFSESDFVHSSTIASALTFCMSEKHLELNNQAGTYITFTRVLNTYTTEGKTVMMLGGKDIIGKEYIVSYIYSNIGPSYMHMVVEIQDLVDGMLHKYYLNPF